MSDFLKYFVEETAEISAKNITHPVSITGRK